MKHHDLTQKFFTPGTIAALSVASVACIGLVVFGIAPGKIEIAHKPVSTISKPSAPLVTSQSEPVFRVPSELIKADSTVERIYREFDNQLLWQGKHGKDRLASLSDAADAAEAQGIETQKLRTAMAGVGTDPARDVALTTAAVELFKDMRTGVVDFDQAADYWKIPAEVYDPSADMVAAIQNARFKQNLTALAPTHTTYAGLVKALATYRKLAADGGWTAIPGDTEILLDREDPRLALVKERLAAEKYDVKNAEEFNKSIAVFQTKHGLKPDGRLGKSTLAELNIPAETRVEQIAVNLERWRHLPRDFNTDYVMANTAEGTVTVISDGAPKMKLRAITGDRKHQTPVLMSKITAVTFNPTWEIPISIAGKEILPKLKKDPTYLSSNNMIVVNGSVTDPHGLYMNWTQYDAKSLPFRLRQKAGSDNSLGFVKFQMSNPYNIYIHDTPSRSLFEKSDRHLSHGCVRVENPRLLAQEVLSGSGKWDEEAVNAAIASGQTQSILLKPTLPVYVMYWTAYVEGDQIHFADDAYHRDAAIAQGLREKQPMVAQAARATREQ